MRDADREGLRVAGWYVVIATAWLLGSDLAVRSLSGPAYEAAQSVKGLLFVLVTGGALYLLVRRRTIAIEAESRRSASVELLLDQVFQTVPIALLLTNAEGLVTFMNPGAAEMLEVSAADAIGRTLEELVVERSPQAATALGNLLKTGVVDGIELPGDAEGSRAVIARAAPVDGRDGSSGWVVALADITESHRAGARSERLVGGYRFLAEALVGAAKILDERQLLARIATTAVETGGYAGAWAALRDGRTGALVEVAAPGLGERAREIGQHVLPRVLERRRPSGDEADDPGFDVVNDLARNPADPWHAVSAEQGFGSLLSITVASPGTAAAVLTLFAAEPGRFDARELEILQTLRGAVAFAFDKAALDRQRLTAEEALEDSERGYRQLFEQHPAPMWVFDTDTLAFLAVNDAAVAKYGYTPEEFLGMTIADIRPPGDIPQLMRTVGQQGGFADAGVWTHRDRDGREFPVHVYSHELTWAGRQAWLVMSLEVARVE